MKTIVAILLYLILALATSQNIKVFHEKVNQATVIYASILTAALGSTRTSGKMAQNSSWVIK